eukprot:scaffold359_cov351-Pinguiococcus_pyrenoidosus.AAC.10
MRRIYALPRGPICAWRASRALSSQPQRAPKESGSGEHSPRKGGVVHSIRKTVLDLLAMGLDSQEKLRLAESFAPSLEEKRRALDARLEALKTDHVAEMDKLKSKLGDEQVEKEFLQKKLEISAQEFSEAEAEMKKEMERLSTLQHSETRKVSELLQSQRQTEAIERERNKLREEMRKVQEELERVRQAPGEADAAASEVVEAAKERHPLFGELLSEMPDKKIYLTPIENLGRIQVWEQQRAFKKKRATRMAADLAKARKEDEYPRPFAGSLVLCDSSPDFAGSDPDKICIIDGQHRVGALTILLEESGFGEHPPSVLTEVHHRRTKPEIRALFIEINKAEPVLEIDLPDPDAGEADASVSLKEVLRAPITEAAEELQFRYPDFFKDSRRCLRPHLHADLLRDDLLTALLEERIKFDKPLQQLTTGDLVIRLEEINSEYEKKDDAEWLNLLGKDEKGKKVLGKATEKALKKSTEHGFYLGLYKGWLGL